MGEYVRGQQVVAESHRANIHDSLRRTPGHGDWTGVKQAMSGGWFASIQSVADGSAEAGGAQRQGEWAAEKATGDARARVGGQTVKRCRPAVGSSRRRIG